MDLLTLIYALALSNFVNSIDIGVESRIVDASFCLGDAGLLALCSDGALKLHRLGADNQLDAHTEPRTVATDIEYVECLPPEQKEAIVIGRDGALFIIDIANNHRNWEGPKLRSFVPEWPRGPKSIQTNLMGTRFSVQSPLRTTVWEKVVGDGGVKWLAVVKVDATTKDASQISYAALAPNGTKLAVAFRNKQRRILKGIAIYDLETKRSVLEIDELAQSFDFSYTGTLLWATSAYPKEAGKVTVHNVATGLREANSLQFRPFADRDVDGLAAIKVSRDGSFLAGVLGLDQELLLWKTVDGAKPTTFGRSGWIQSGGSLPTIPFRFLDDVTLIAFQVGEWRVIDCVSGKVKQTIRKDGRSFSYMRRVAVSTDGKFVACPSFDSIHVFPLIHNTR